MKNKLIYPMVLVVGFGAACGGSDSEARSAAQQQYETVQEGSAAGVTSTLAGPGETLPPITGTNADTTTAFALNPNVAPAGMPQQAQAGAIPSYPTADVPPPMMSSSPSPSYTPAPARRPATSTYQPTQPVQQASQPQPAPAQPAPAQPAQPQPAEPQPTEPVEAAGPADTDTATTTQTQPEPPKPAEQPKPEPKKEEPAPPPADDTSGTQAEEPPPPPPYRPSA